MAISTIKNELKEALRAYKDKPLRRLLGKTAINQVRITTENTVPAFQKAVKELMRYARFDEEYVNYINKTYNTTASWKNILKECFDEFGSPNIIKGHKLSSLKELQTTKLDAAYILEGSTADNFIVRLYSGDAVKGRTGTNLDTFNRKYREIAFNKWKETLPVGDAKLRAINVEQGGTRFAKLSDPDPTNQTGATAKGVLGTSTPFAHDNDSTVGKYGLPAVLNQIRGGPDGTVPNDTYLEALNFKGIGNIELDLRQSVMDNLSIEYTEDEVDMPGGGTRIIRKTDVGLITGELRKQQKELSDWSNISKLLLGTKDKPSAIDEILRKNTAHLNKDQALEAEGSESARKRLAKKAAKKIVDNIVNKNPNAKAIKTQRVVKAKRKKVRVTGKGLVRSKAQKLPSMILVPAVGNRPRAQKQKEKGKRTQTLTLAKLKASLNRRLPAEVRRNMGRPALENRTGRFSNSVYITSLKQAQKTIVGEYTYQLSPYETFENTGERRWPNGYNPKPLITKSIRNLAQEVVENKFTLRRV